MNKAYKFALLVIAGQLQGFATLFRRKNRSVADWLNWAGQAIQDVMLGRSLDDQPEIVGLYTSPIPDNWKERFQIVAVQVSSLALAIRNYDDNFDGTDDKVATVLEKIATALDVLGN